MTNDQSALINTEEMIEEAGSVLSIPEFVGQPGLTCTLLGSLRFMPYFNEVIDTLTTAGVRVLAPRRGNIAGEVNGFKTLDADGRNHPVDIERGFVDSLLNSDFVYIINPGGYIGATSVTELAIAQGHGVHSEAMEPLDRSLDPNSIEWQSLCAAIPACPITRIVTRLEDRSDRLYQGRRQACWFSSAERFEGIARYVLSADWVKHRGLGAILKDVRRRQDREELKLLGPFRLLTEYEYSSSKEGVSLFRKFVMA